MRILNRPAERISRAAFVAYALLASVGVLLTEKAPAAEATSNPIYVGVRYGASDFDSSVPVTRLGKIYSQEITRQWTNRSSKAWSVNAGFQATRYFAVEVGYWDFGEGTFNETNRLFNPQENTREEYVGSTAAAKGLTFGFAASYPWKNFRVSAKIAALRNDVSLTGPGTRYVTRFVSPTTSPPVSSVTKNESTGNTTAMYGAALSYTFANHYRVMVEWRKTEHMGDRRQNGGLDVEVRTLGFEYQF